MALTNMQRAPFFQNSVSMLMVTNKTGTQPWLVPYGILSNDPAMSDSIALAAGSDTSLSGLNGIRVYYGSRFCAKV
jgi:hypothetical protein